MIDQISKCINSRLGWRVGPPTGIAVHRFRADGVVDAASLADWSHGVAAVGYRLPYSYVQDCDGVWYQAMPDNRWGWHCRKKSKTYIAVVMLGDFRRRHLPLSRAESLIELCASLAIKHGFGAKSVHGHTEIPDGTAWPNHDCPGKMIDMNEIRNKIAIKIKELQGS